MNYMNEIMARLQKGESVDTIAAEMTRALNEANDEFQKQQEKNAALKEKAMAMRKALNAVADLLDTFGLDKEIGDSLREMDAEDLVNEIEREMPFMKMLIEMDQEKKREKPAAKPSGDSIEDFLNKFVR
jgi:chaperonin cofactor prefoldin